MKTLKIYFVGVGGQGNVLASKLVGEAALAAGVPVVLSETHGMAQRGGVVESTAVLGGAASPTIADACADILLAFEPLEAVRALNKVRKDGLVVTSIAPIKPFNPTGDDKAYPPVDTLLDYLRSRCGRVLAFDGKKNRPGAGQSPRAEYGHARGAVCHGRNAHGPGRSARRHRQGHQTRLSG